MLKGYEVVGGWMVAWSILVSAPVHFGFRSYWDFGGFGPKGWGQGLTITEVLDDL